MADEEADLKPVDGEPQSTPEMKGDEALVSPDYQRREESANIPG